MRSILWPLLCATLLAIFAPASRAQQAPLRRIAFGSCADQARPQPIWEPIVAIKPDIFLFIGDAIYADTKDMAVMKKKYDQLAAQPGYQKILRTCPMWAVWDDHDFGWNDAGEEYPKKKESQQLFLEFFKEAKDSPRWERPGLYDAKVFGPADKSVQIIMLDTRYFRSPLKKDTKRPFREGPYVASADPKLTMLGANQWKWLEKQLKVPAKVRLLISTVQLVAEDHHWEKWMNMPLEREKLYRLIRETQAGGVIVLSGDRHLAELSLMDAGIGYPLYDLTSSGLTQGFYAWRPQEVNRHRVSTMNQGNNFGLVTIDWDQEDPRISLQIRDESGDIFLQQKIALSYLQPGFIKASKAPGKSVVLADGTILTGEEIKKRIDSKVTLTMTVRVTGASTTKTLVFLNSHDRSDDDNFTVVLDAKAQESLKKAGIDAPRTYFVGKTIRVTGTLSLFRDRPQIIVSDAAQIEEQK